jgi:predicted phage-related endonuclease
VSMSMSMSMSSTATTITIPISASRSGEEWLKARYYAITGTDVGKIMGVDTETSTKKLFETKAREIDPLANAGAITQQFLRMGREYESVARDTFVSLASTTGLVAHYVPSMVTHRKIPWLKGTPDYVVTDWETMSAPIVVEFKTHFYPTPFEAHPIRDIASIPLKHWLQVQHYMEIMDINKSILFSWTIKGGHRGYIINRDWQFWDHVIFPRISRFWELLCDNRHSIDSPGWIKAVKELTWKNGHKAIMTDSIARAMEDTTSVWKVAS